MSDDYTKEFVKSFSYATAFWSSISYLGYDSKIKSIINYLKESDKNENCYNVERPSDIIPWKHNSFEYDVVLELIWMILVIRFGDYGTSPAGGWIYKDNLKNCIEELELWYTINWGYTEVVDENHQF